MSADSLRNFTVRFMESALERVESTAKTFYGGRLSTGEAIRRLAEERLDQIESEQPREPIRTGLLRILREWRSARTLSSEDLRFIATWAHEAYSRCRHAFVSRDVLVANVTAFREAVSVVTRGKIPKATEPTHRHFIGNLQTSAADLEGGTLTEAVDRWLEVLPEYPSPEQAEFASKNLLAFLNEERTLATPHLDKALGPYLPSLLQLAIRGYWYAEQRPLVEPQAGFPHPRPLAVGPINRGRISFTPILRDHEFTAGLAFNDRGLVLTLNHYIEAEEFTTLTHYAVEGHEARGEMFTWTPEPSNPKGVVFFRPGMSQLFKVEELVAVDQCLQAFWRDPKIASTLDRLAYVYGRI